MQNVKQKVALSSIGASAGLTLAKGIVGLSTGSLAILSEAAHSLIDFAATVMTYFAVRVTNRTPVRDRLGALGSRRGSLHR
jgi:divalent metal cation (Fe/Co/Zn/Cd) transporter